MNPKSLLCGISAVSVLLLWACQTGSLQAGLAEQESRWFNVTDFGAVGEVQWRDGRPMLVFADGDENVFESLY